MITIVTGFNKSGKSNYIDQQSTEGGIVIEYPENLIGHWSNYYDWVLDLISNNENNSVFIETYSEHLINNFCLAVKLNKLSLDKLKLVFIHNNIANVISTDIKGNFFMLLQNGKRTVDLPNGFMDSIGNTLIRLI